MRSNPQSIIIRDIDTLAEMRQVEVLQKEIWGVEDLEVFPALALRPLKELGGVLIGAFHNLELVGFVFGFPGIIAGETVIHSDMLAVKPEFRSLRLGFLLKLAQRDEALRLGVKKVTWTFDPMRARNAHLNFAKLGVTSNRYEIDFYGQTTSPLHQGGTDRLWVTWELDSIRVKERLANPGEPEEKVQAGAAKLIQVSTGGTPEIELAATAATLLIEIPTKDISTSLLRTWRVATREAFTLAIKSGYEVTEFWRGGSETGVYVLNRVAT